MKNCNQRVTLESEWTWSTPVLNAFYVIGKVAERIFIRKITLKFLWWHYDCKRVVVLKFLPNLEKHRNVSVI